MLLDTPICDTSFEAPPFSLKTPLGTLHSLASCMGNQGLLVAFICNHCPYVIAIADRLAIDCKDLLAEGIGVVAIMSNDYRDLPSDSPKNMEKFALKHGFPFPYLVDEDQSVGRAYGAVCTPDFFGFNNQAKLQYRGRLDDAGMKQSTNRQPELVEAMRLIAKTGQGPEVQTPSMGCSIKWS